MTVECFRGVRHLELTLGELAVVIAENNHGKTSVFDVLGLCLGGRGAEADARFRDVDFHRRDDGSVGDIRIVLHFAPATEPAAGGEADPGEGVRVEFFGTHEDRRIVRRFVEASGEPLRPAPPDTEVTAFLARYPVLLLRFAQPLVGLRGTHGSEESDPPAERRGRRSLADTVSRVYQDLARTRAPLPSERINQGLEAAHALLDGSAGDGEAPIHRMLEELREEVRRWARPQAADSMVGLTGSGSHNLALLLVLGSLLDVNGHALLPEDASPIIAIEEPEAHLHPILLASTWDIIRALRAQTIVTTNSGEFLSSVPMTHLRRLVKQPDDRVHVHRLEEGSLRPSDLRRVAYHIRARRGGVLFARCWMLVEGESEFWLMSQLADVMGYDLESEGVRAIEFAQCGVVPLVRLANDLGISWHLLADGDESGTIYARDALRHAVGPAERHVSQLERHDIEQCLWYDGYEDVFRNAARIAARPDRGGPPPRRIIEKAVRRTSKPYLALAVAEAAASRGRGGIPRILRRVIEHSVSMAREGAEAHGTPGHAQRS
jgi:putative ATP-dependent endonuclease of OLD family